MTVRRTFTTILLLSMLSALICIGSTIRCVVCGRAVPSRYFVYEGRNCCSESCVDQLRPRCSICGKTITGEYFTNKDQLFCSDACFDTILQKCELCNAPVREGYTITSHVYCKACEKDTPRCFSCGLPAAHPTRLEDERDICGLCMRWAVKKGDHAQRHYDRALRQLQAWTSLELESVPKLVLVDRTTMQNLSQDIRKSDSPESLRGLYSRQVTTTTITRLGFRTDESTDVNEQIYIVDHLHDAVFRSTAIHELMHDLLQEQFPKLKDAPLWVEEGICQLAAAEYCSLRHYTDILHGIENNTDPDYGDGYRYIRKQVGVRGWPALKRWMEHLDVSTLPETAPRTSTD